MKGCLCSFAICLLVLPCTPAAAGPPTRTEAEAQLKQAAEAYRGQRFQECAALVTGLDKSPLFNPDAALFLEAQCRFYAGDRSGARDRFARLAKDFKDSPQAVLSKFRLADCDWEIGKREKAALEYRRAATGQSDPRIDPVVGLFHRAEVLLERQDDREGWRLWTEILARHPDHPLASSPPNDRVAPPIGVADALRIAGRLHRLRRWEEALTVLDSAPTPASDREQYQLAYNAGRILFDMPGRKDEAARLLLAARDHASSGIQAEKAWFWGSRSLTRTGHIEESIQSHLAMVEKYPHGQNAANALFFAGFLLQDDGHCDRAQPVLARTWERYPASFYAGEARWFSAWCHLQHEEWKEAIETLAPLTTQPSEMTGGRALYWTGFAHQALQAQDQARSDWKRTIEQHPLSYYAELAKLRLGSETPALEPPPEAAKRTTLSDPLLEAEAELAASGLDALAAALLDRHQREFLGRHPGTAGLLALLDAYRAAGDYHQPWSLSLNQGGSALRGPPTAATLPFWEHAYPRCAREKLTSHAGSDSELVLFMQAIMRSESGFDPLALSIADARGLMQLTPNTATRVAADARLEFSPDGLFDPDTNILLGSNLLSRLAAKFHRQWPIVAASYNAGTPAVMRWCEKNGQLPLDRFVEAIPYAETRLYAKVVYEAFLRYAYLEGAPLPTLSLDVDPGYLNDGIDF